MYLQFKLHIISIIIIKCKCVFPLDLDLVIAYIIFFHVIKYLVFVIFVIFRISFKMFHFSNATFLKDQNALTVM